MNTLIRIAAVGAIALVSSTAHVNAGGITEADAAKASKQLTAEGRSLADIIKAAEQQTGGKAVAVALRCAPSKDSSRRESGSSNADEPRTNDSNRVTGQNADSQRNLEYRVTCVLNDSQMRDAYVCATTGDVRTVLSSSEFADADRMNDDSFSAKDRYADRQGIFSAGPDGHYERLVVWHFVPNDAASANRNDSSTGIRVKHDPSLENHHPRNAQNTAGQNRPGTYASNDQHRGSEMDRDNENRPGEMILGSKLLNADVTNSKNQDLGEIEDIAINPTNGEIAYTAVAYGGVLGIGEKTFAVPCNRVLQASGERVYLDLDKSEFENNPGIEKDKWPTAPDSELSQKNSDQKQHAPASKIKRLSTVVGSELKSSNRETLGTIEDSVVDTRADQIAYLIVNVEGSDDFVAVPCTAVAINSDDCVIAMTENQFKALPTFKEGKFPIWMDVAWNEQTHSLFNARPYWKAQADSIPQTNPRMAG
jgi:sporulation protein YlmC with PRC-barrel domain